MPCLKLPTVTAPTLPAPFTLGLPGLSGLTFDINLCCKLPPVSLPIPPIPLPAVVLNPAVIATLNSAISAVVTYINSLSVPCPIE